jgi:hypothetical protein
MACGCGARPPQGGIGLGTVGGGGGTEILSDASGDSAASGSSGSSGKGNGDASAGSGTSGNGTGSGTGGSSGSSSAPSGASATSGASGSSNSETTDAGDAGTGGLHLSIGGSLHLVSLQWTISGPHTYHGSVTFGDAQSFEWVVGGIVAGSGYTLSVTATDASGDPCNGTSQPFSVEPGRTIYTLLTITCHTTVMDPADVATGSVAIDASVVSAD